MDFIDGQIDENSHAAHVSRRKCESDVINNVYIIYLLFHRICNLRYIIKLKSYIHSVTTSHHNLKGEYAQLC